ncbi:hypothetical protein P4S72_25625 [Vibrio sp. PP-XX7]
MNTLSNNPFAVSLLNILAFVLNKRIEAIHNFFNHHRYVKQAILIFIIYWAEYCLTKP